MKDVPLDKQGCPYQKQNYVAVIQNCWEKNSPVDLSMSWLHWLFLILKFQTEFSMQKEVLF
jgi:hypothetical protein